MANFVITGGNSGIGAAIKQQLIDEGHSVIVVDITAADIQADLSTEQGRQLAVVSIRKRCAAGLDGLVACAGSAPTAAPKLTTSLNYYGAIELVEGTRDLVAKNEAVLFWSHLTPLQCAKTQSWLTPY